FWVLSISGSGITLGSKKGIARGLDGTFFYAFLARLKLLIPLSVIILVIAFYVKSRENYVFSTLLLIIGFYLIFGYLIQTSFYEFLVAKERFKERCFWEILIPLISMGGSALVAYLTKNIIYFAISQLGSSTILSWIAILLLLKKERIMESYRKREIDKGCVPYGLKLIPANLVYVTAYHVSHFIIGPFFGFANLAIFSVANKLKEKFASITKSFYPLIYADFAKREKDELIKLIKSYLIKIGFFGIILVSVFIFVGWFYIKFFLPKGYQHATIYMAILALGLIPGVLTVVLHTILESHFCYKELTVINIIPSLLRIVLILICGYLWRIIGVCFALAVTNWISFGFYYFLTMQKKYVTKFIEEHHFIENLVSRY
ncbi:MAG: oligosaccharide flippase family protein, partial [Elusimicrobiota bacterium]|nr:oligosaccharide flippase family protein [Elusimicrobiota bacterium]